MAGVAEARPVREQLVGVVPEVGGDEVEPRSRSRDIPTLLEDKLHVFLVEVGRAWRRWCPSLGRPALTDHLLFFFDVHEIRGHVAPPSLMLRLCMVPRKRSTVACAPRPPPHPGFIALLADVSGAELRGRLPRPEAERLIRRCGDMLAGMHAAGLPAEHDWRLAAVANARMLLAVRRARRPAALAAGRGIPALVPLAEPIHLGHDGRHARRRLALVRLAEGCAPGASLFAARLPYAGVLGAVLAAQADGAVALGDRAGVLVAGLAVALDLAHVRAALFVAADVVAAGHRAGFDGLVADYTAGPAAGVVAAVGSLVAAGVEAAFCLAGVFVAGVTDGWRFGEGQQVVRTLA